MLDQSLIQEEYKNKPGAVYVNTSSCGLLGKSGIEKMHHFMSELHTSGSQRSEQFLVEDLPRIRQKVSQFIQADQDEIALIPNFSYGLNSLISILQPYKNVLLLEGDYPSLTQPFVLNDFEITWAGSENGFLFDLEKIENAIKQNGVRIVAVSHVQYLTGFCIDIEALGKICQSYGALLIVDGTQSLGAIPYSFKKSAADIYISSNYKWMNAGFGTGIMAIKKSFLSNHEPKIGGFASFINTDGSWGYTPSILSYEPGHLNMGGFIMLEDAINFKNQLGVENIYQHNMGLMEYFISGIKLLDIEIVGPASRENRSSIFCIKETDEIIGSLKNNQIVFKSREGNIRFGIHFHNSKKDIDRILKALEKAK